MSAKRIMMWSVCAVMSWAGSASAQSVVMHATRCTTSGTTWVDRDYAGNESTTYNAYVTCGLGRLTATAPTRVFVDFRGNGGPMSCDVTAYNWNGTFQYNEYKPHDYRTGPGVFIFNLRPEVTGYIRVSCTIPVKNANGVAGVLGINHQ